MPHGCSYASAEKLVMIAPFVLFMVLLVFSTHKLVVYNKAVIIMPFKTAVGQIFVIAQQLFVFLMFLILECMQQFKKHMWSLSQSWEPQHLDS